jgi:hypothetical protein
MPAPSDEERLARRLAARGVRLVEIDAARLAAECITCRTRWEIAGARLGPAHEDEGADWWWCPHGCNRAE